MSLRTPTLTLIAFLTVASGLAFAAGPNREHREGTPGERFAAADRNSDGALDRAEAGILSPRIAERFEAIDRDNSQRIERDELRAAMRQREANRELTKARRDAMRAKFAFLDSDGDRALSLAEIGSEAPRLAQRFGEMDKNRDGQLVPEEMRAFAEAQRAARRQ